MNLRTPLTAIYAVFMIGATSTGVSPAQAIPIAAGSGAVTSVSGVAPTSNGDVPFGCPLGPFSAGANMSVNQMDNGCALHYTGPNETAAQSATDISTAISNLSASIAASYVGNSTLTTTLDNYALTSAVPALAPVQSVNGGTGAITGLETVTALNSTLTGYSNTSAMNTAISSALASYLTSSSAAGTYLTQSNAASTYCAQANCPTTSAMNAAIAAAAYTFSVSTTYTSRTLSTGTAYQCTNTAKPCMVYASLATSTSITLGSGTTNTQNIVVGSTSAVASGTGAAIMVNSAAITGVGLSLGVSSTSPVSFLVPTGYYFAVRAITGAATIPTAYDQAVG